MTKEVVEFRSQRLFLCEGVEDAAFLRALISARSLGESDVRALSDMQQTAGNTGFETALASIIPVKGFLKLRHIILVVDADEHYGDAFSSIAKQVERANARPGVNARYCVPVTPYASSGGRPEVCIMLLPAPQAKGALESLLLSAARDHSALAHIMACSENAISESRIRAKRGRDKWNTAQIDKASLRIALALAHKKNPMLGLGQLWLRAPTLIPLKSQAFDQLAKAITSLR